MFTTRGLEAGEWVKNKYRNLNKGDAQKECFYWRQFWEGIQNKAYVKAGLDLEVSAKSCEDQGELKQYEHIGFKKYNALRNEDRLETEKEASGLNIIIDSKELKIVDLIGEIQALKEEEKKFNEAKIAQEENKKYQKVTDKLEVIPIDREALVGEEYGFNRDGGRSSREAANREVERPRNEIDQGISTDNKQAKEVSQRRDSTVERDPYDIPGGDKESGAAGHRRQVGDHVETGDTTAGYSEAGDDEVSSGGEEFSEINRLVLESMRRRIEQKQRRSLAEAKRNNQSLESINKELQGLEHNVSEGQRRSVERMRSDKEKLSDAADHARYASCGRKLRLRTIDSRREAEDRRQRNKDTSETIREGLGILQRAIGQLRDFYCGVRDAARAKLIIIGRLHEKIDYFKHLFGRKDREEKENFTNLPQIEEPKTIESYKSPVRFILQSGLESRAKLIPEHWQAEKTRALKQEANELKRLKERSEKESRKQGRGY